MSFYINLNGVSNTKKEKFKDISVEGIPGYVNLDVSRVKQNPEEPNTGSNHHGPLTLEFDASVKDKDFFKKPEILHKEVSGKVYDVALTQGGENKLMNTIEIENGKVSDVQVTKKFTVDAAESDKDLGLVVRLTIISQKDKPFKVQEADNAVVALDCSSYY